MRKERRLLAVAFLLSICPGLLTAEEKGSVAATGIQAIVPGKTVGVTEPIPTESRRIALETAGAFVNDDFRIRDGEWSGHLSRGVPVFLQVTLFAREHYWFVAASQAIGVSLRITLYDATGKPVKGEVWHDASGGDASGKGSRCAVGVAPTQSGKYFAGVEMIGDAPAPPVDFSLVYCYK